MAWYDDQNKTLFVGTYANEKQFQWDKEAAERRGWVVQEPGAAEGEGDEPIIGADESVADAAAVGGADRGADRLKGRIEVTFVRAEDWLASRKEEIATALQSDAARAADAKEGKFVKAAADLEKAELQLKESLEAALASTSEPTRDIAERQLLNDLRQVIVRRQATLKAMDEAIKEMQSAVSLGASEFARSIASHMKAQVAGQARLEAEQSVLAAQEHVARAAKEWRDANDRRRTAEEELRKRNADFEAKDAGLSEHLVSRNAALAEMGKLTR
jgi:hypothetical protein